MRCWHLDSPALFEKEKSEVVSVYPGLVFSIESDIVYVRGTFPISFEDQELDRYQIEIQIPKDYPDGLPLVWETGGRIPRERDRHINPDPGTACLFIYDERYDAWPKGSSLLDFLNVPVRNFFLGQSLVEQGKPWPFGEWKHGEEGIRQFYAEKLGTNDLVAIVKFLEYLNAKQIKGHWSCPCGSQKKLRDCHLEVAKWLRESIDSKTIDSSLNRLKHLRGG